MTLSVLGLGLVLAACWAVAYASGSPISASRHVFYLPVLLGAARFGYRGALATAAAATLLAGPLVPIGDVPMSTWVLRGLFLFAVGVTTAALIHAARRTTSRESRLAAREQRLHAQRTALIQTVSHEFRTPLTVIHGVAETLVARDSLLDPTLRPVAQALERAERRLSQMVGVVLAAADALDGPLEQEALDPEDLIREVADTLGDEPIDRIRIDVVGDPDVLVTSRSYAQLLLRCLLDNAVRFSPADQPVDVFFEHHDGWATVTIRDRGPGVDADFVEEAFEPFTQADTSTQRRHGGLGLGLYTARQLAERLGGEVDVRPAAGRGTVATVRLPQRRGADRNGQRRLVEAKR